MATQFATSLVREADSLKAGQLAASQAKKKLRDPKKIDLAIVFTSSEYDQKKVIQGIKKEIGNTPFLGCSSAGQFSNEGVTKKGVVLALIASDTHRFYTGFGKGVNKNSIKAVEEATANFPIDVESYPYQSAILLVDGLAGNGEEAVLAASSILGPMVKFAGGAAGDDYQFKQTFVLGEDEALSDAVSMALIASKKPIVIAVQHGHLPISKPLTITKASGNILYEIEDKPAWDVWKDHLREIVKERGIDIDKLNSQEISKLLMQYEAGLMTGSEYKIRFPTSANPDGSLNFVCAIVEGSVIKIMNSDEEGQIQAARRAAELALKTARGTKLAGAIIFDCACRAMILKEHFGKAIDAQKKVVGNLPFIGCETYGEIAMEMGQLSGFHNTTTVIMLIPE